MKPDIIKSTRNWFVQNNQDRSGHDAIVKYLGLLTVVVVIPFAFNEFAQGRYHIFLVECLAILLILSDIIYTQVYHRSLFLRVLNMSGLGAIIWILVFQKGVVGIYWSYPYVILLHFVLYPRIATAINIIFLLGMTPLALYAVGEMETYRIIATLTISSMVAIIFSSITAQQQQLIKQKSEETFRTAFDSSPSGMLITRLTGEILEANDSFCENMGFLASEVIGKTSLELGIWKYTEQRDHYMDLIKQQGYCKGYEVELNSKDGRAIYALLTGSLIDVNGESCVLSNSYDITERKQAEEELLHITELLRNVINTSKDFIFVKDTQLRTILCNVTFAHAQGKKPKELYGRTDIENGWSPELVKGNPEKGIRGFETDDLEALAGKTVHNPSDPANINGEIRYFDTMKTPLKDEQGNILGVLGIARDITERKQAEEDLQRIKEAVDNTTDAIGISTPEGHHFYQNKSFTQLFGYSVEELGVIHPRVLYADAKDAKAVFDTIMDGNSCSVECEMVSKDGHHIPISLRANAIKNAEGKIIGLVGVHTDITERKQAEEELSIITSFMQKVFDTAPNFIFVKDRESKFMLVNKAIADAYGSTVDNLIGKSDADFNPDKKENDHFHQDDLEVIDNQKDKFIPEEKITTSKGELHWLQTIKRPIIEDDGKVNCLLGISTDITERKQAEEKLKESETKFRNLVEGSLQGIFVHREFKPLFANQQCADIFGFTNQEEILKLDSVLEVFWSEEEQERIRGYNRRRISGGEAPPFYECRGKHQDGHLLWFENHVTKIDWQGEAAIQVTMVEITERKQADEKISYQASHDALTGLINRHEFERRGERLLTTIKEDKGEHAMCYLDLDQFKIVNDTCGHVAGDEMLHQLSTVLQNTIRHSDTLARLGGDEFGVLMEHCSLDDAHRVTTSLLKVIQDYQFTWEEHSFKVGVSIGLVPITDSIANLTELLKEADAACYMAKDKGRNRIHVYHTQDSEIAQRHGEMQWVTRIYRAMEEDRFCLYAQSIVPLDGSNDKHYELLIRMIGDKGVIIPPGAFLPAAERYNLISQLDRWVVKKAFILLAEHPEFLNQIHFISINLSGPTLADESFLSFVIKLLDSTGIKGEKICFEITETAAISNLGKADIFIATLNQYGCSFALDDFGSGLSSFGYLKNLDVDYLKIDGMFVKDIVDDPIDHAMVKSINEIGQVMGMQTIAEFVENDEIKGMLREIGVNYAQGYGIEKPMPLDNLLNQ